MGILKTGFVSDRITQHNKSADIKNQIDITGNKAKPVGLYGYFHREGTMLQFSGFGSRDEKGGPINGRIGSNKDEQSLEYGQQAARGACLNFLNNLATACDGNLDAIKSISMRVDVNCNANFKLLPKVADGASQLLMAVFGKYIGTPIRTAAGASSLPNDMTVEISGIAYISKELAKSLDLQEVRHLVEVLRMANLLIKADVDFGRGDIFENEITLLQKIFLASQLQKMLLKLDTMDANQFQKMWSSEQNKELMDGIESKQDLFDHLTGRALGLDLQIKPIPPKSVLASSFLSSAKATAGFKR